jgi:hypothetical protein
MTAANRTRAAASLGDRFAETAVVLVTLAALALGWTLMSGVENRSVAFTSGGISAEVPDGWLSLRAAVDEVLHLTDRTSSGFATTYIIQVHAVPVDSGPAEYVSLLTLDRGKDLTAYRVLDQAQVQVEGRDAVQVEYVYVESDPNLTRADLPAVVHGLDYIFVEDGQAVVVSFQADQDDYAADLARFYRFLASVSY